MLMKTCKNILGMIWMIGFIIPFLLLTIQTILGARYGSNAEGVWAWFLPTMLPTVSLIIGVFIGDAVNQSLQDKIVNNTFFWLAVVLSVVYLLIVNLLFFLNPFSDLSQAEMMKQSSLYLAPLQGLLTGLLGVFFTNKSS